MKVVVIDGQGGGVGRSLVEQLKKEMPGQSVMAVGTNVMATGAMLRAGADAGATGENAVRVNCADADLIMGPMGIVLCDAMMGELTGEMARAVGASAAMKILLPVGKCRVRVAGAGASSMAAAIEDAVRIARSYIDGEEVGQ